MCSAVASWPVYLSRGTTLFWLLLCTAYLHLTMSPSPAQWGHRFDRVYRMEVFSHKPGIYFLFLVYLYLLVEEVLERTLRISVPSHPVCRPFVLQPPWSSRFGWLPLIGFPWLPSVCCVYVAWLHLSFLAPSSKLILW